MLDEIEYIRKRYQRSKSDPEVLRSELISQGVNVLELRPIARLIPDPFHGIRFLPALYEIRADFNGRRGFWYARTASDSAPIDWVWQDIDGYETSPRPDLGPAFQGRLKAVTWTHDFLLVGFAVLVITPLIIWLLL